MKELPKRLKQKLRKLQSLIAEVSTLHKDIESIFKQYNIDIENFTATGSGEIQTEAFTFITYNEGNVEDNINEIEKVFLYYTNKNGDDEDNERNSY